MKNILGIDIGGSTTKIIGYRDGKIFSPLLVKANDPKASLYGAFGKFMSENHRRGLEFYERRSLRYSDSENRRV